MQKNSPIQHINQKELSERLGVSCRTLERWRWIGIGPRFIKIGGRVRYRLCDIETYEHSRLCQATSDRYYFDEQMPIHAAKSDRIL
ncbi:MAG: DNA-binding protein [Alphaproteobacteria bacterium]|nr:MAG: DNA-binding protein [Alphaproteobacteria bacterium]